MKTDETQITLKQIITTLNIFIDKKIRKYTSKDEYKGVTYNIGYIDALLTVKKFLKDITK